MALIGCLDDGEFSARQRTANLPEPAKRTSDVQGSVVGQILRASALTHSIGIDEVEIQRQEILPNSGVQWSSSKKEVVTLIQADGFLDVVKDQQFSQFVGDAWVLFVSDFGVTLRTLRFGPSGCIKRELHILVFREPFALAISIILS